MESCTLEVDSIALKLVDDKAVNATGVLKNQRVSWKRTDYIVLLFFGGGGGGTYSGV